MATQIDSAFRNSSFNLKINQEAQNIWWAIQKGHMH